MKLLLISANKFKKPYPVYPLGLSYIETYLKTNIKDIQIDWFDFAIKTSCKDFKIYLNNSKPDFIAISLRNVDDVDMFHQQSFIKEYKKIVQICRENTKKPIIIGGAAYSIFPKKMYEYLKPDFGIFGEGEKTILDLIKALKNGKEVENIDGLVFAKNGKIIANERRNYVKNLELKYNYDIIQYYWQNSGMIGLQTKRGCPYKCIYCTYPIIEGREMRTLNREKIVQTLEELYFTKGIDYVFFTDSVFNIKNQYNYELADRIIKSKIKISWGAYFSIKNIDEALLKILKKSGLKHIEFGTESLSDITLKKYGKPFQVQDIIEISNICNNLKIDFAHFLILAGWGETEESLEQTFENSKKINRTAFFPFVGMRIYPKTFLQKLAIKENIITEDDDLLLPKYYISKNINLDTIKERAFKTGKSWVFPDKDVSSIMNKLRQKNKKGPLWEYLLR